MKRLSKIAAIFAVFGLLFATIACDNGGSDGDSNDANAVKTVYAELQVDGVEVDYLSVDDTAKIKVTVSPSTVSQEATFELSQDSSSGIITVDDDGTVHAVSKGKVTVVVKSKADPSKKNNCGD